MIRPFLAILALAAEAQDGSEKCASSGFNVVIGRSTLFQNTTGTGMSTPHPPKQAISGNVPAAEVKPKGESNG